jgi:hypothetical protein
VLFSLFLAFFFNFVGLAEAKPMYSVSTSIGFPMVPIGGTPSIGNGIQIVDPIGKGWSLMGDVGFSTNFVTSQPGPRLIVGVSRRVKSDGLNFGLSSSYKFSPDYGNGSAHIIGFGPAFIRPWDKVSLTVSFPVGYNLTTESTSISMVVTGTVRIVE